MSSVPTETAAPLPTPAAPPEPPVTNRHTWTAVRLLIGLAVLASLGLSLVIFRHSLDRQRQDTATAAASLAESFSHELALRSYAVEALSAHAEDLLEARTPPGFDVVPHLVPMLSRGGYAMVVPPGYRSEEVGNLTGGGEVPRAGSAKAHELAVAFALSPSLRALLKQNREAPWAYYMSRSGFLYIYPRAHLEQTFWTPQLQEQHFSWEGQPLTRYHPRVYWSQLYEDHGGKGLLATVSRMVQRRGELMGTVSVDVSAHEMLRELDLHNVPGATVRLVDRKGVDMLAHKALLERADLEALPRGKLVPRGDDELTIFALPPSDWSLAVLASRNARLWAALTETLPYGLVCLFMLATATLLTVLVRSLRAHDAQRAASIQELESRNRSLQEARREAERANRAKSDFLATMSHELRTPLNGVIGLAADLADEREPARIDEGLRLIRQSADTLVAVINDVLDFSKIESGALQLESVPYSPAEALQAVAGLMQGRARERGNVLLCRCDSDVPPHVLGDPTRFRQIALNLVSNAVKFTTQGRVSCVLSARDEALVLTVTDTGIGIAPEQQARLFTPFVQADASTTRRYGGTGLGLAIVERLTRALGGTIHLHSVPQEGSTFTIVLPATPCAAPADAPGARVGGPLTVLLVEDNAVNRLVSTRLLEKLGHRVRVVTDGAQALAHLEESPCDLVLMDCHMPVMDGFEATRLLRERGQTVPIYALSAAVTSDDRARCAEVGMTGFLAKPLDPARLREAIETVSAAAAPVA